MIFLVEQEAIQPTEVIEIELIVAGIEGLHPTRNSYYVVNKPCGDYLQFAGSKDRLVAECRIFQKERFTHYVFAHNTESVMVDKIECNVGPIRVNQNQVLTIVDAKRLIMAFCNNVEWSAEYSLTDVTERFL
jgi:hypothetical protein